MKRKSLLIMLLMALFVPLAMMGQNRATLTVCDGSASGTTTTTNNNVPIYGLYVDTQGQNSEFIIPAETEGMSNMTGGIISKLAFYITNSPQSWGSPTVQVYMGEVEGTTLSSLNGPTNFTTVWSGTLSNQNATMEITLSTPYTYLGGNLLIGMYVQTASSTYKTTTFSGITAPSGSSRYNSGSGSGSAVSFLPKTTFTYTVSSTPQIVLNPNSATVLTGSTQALTATTLNVTGTPSISYSTSNASVATVSGSGTSATVTGVSAGTATITATMTYNSNTYTAQCAITVEDPSYCTPNPTSVDGKGITTLTFGSGDYVVNNSNSNGLPASSPYYGDYTSMVGGYEPGETATVTITYSTGTSTVYSYGTLIWVDWNKNYTFEDSEIVYTGTSAQGSNGTPQVLTATFTVPATQAADDYRMRIAGADSYFDSYIGGSSTANHDPCFTSTYAVCHDYTLRVVSNSNCPTPTITNITATANSATITTDSEASSFNVRYREYVETTPTTYDFEDGWQGWTTFQGTTTSPNSWMHNTEYTAYDSNGDLIVPECHNSSSGMMLSESYISAATSGGSGTAVIPDNYLVSPQFRLGGSITFYAASRMSNYPAEKFSVLVSESGNTSASDFTHTELTVTLTSNSWQEYTIDLSAYSGMGYVAIRHYDCEDQHLLYIDDVNIYGPSIQWQTGNNLTITGLEPATTYEVQVQANCGDEDGLSAWSTVATFTTLEIPAVPVESINVTPNEIYPTVGATYSIVFTVLPADATNTAVTFSSSDEDVATVDENGTVTAVAAGTATITIAATDGSGVTGTLTVNVMNIDVEEITASDVTVMSGETATINYQVLPEQATDKSVTFTSANTAIATVDENGVVTGVAVGETTITIASVQNPEVTTEITVTVTSDPNAVQFTLNVDKTVAAPGDVITVEAYLNAPESGDYNGFTGLVLGLHFDTDAFEVYGDPVKGPVANACTMAMTALPNETHPDLVQCSCVMPVGTPNTTTGLVFTAQFTVLTGVELGSYTFYAEPTAANNFVYNPDMNIGPSNIQYEYIPSTVEVGNSYTLEIIGHDNPGGGWNLIASPLAADVTPTEANGFRKNRYDLYRFNQSADNEWENWKASGTDHYQFNLESGKGYLYANSGNVTLTFTGTPYSSNGEVTLSRDENAEFPGMNLVGNPFPELAYLPSGHSFYTMRSDNMGLVATTDNSVQAMVGIFVEALSDGEILTFTTTESGSKGAMVSLNVSRGRGEFIDRAIVRFGEGRTLSKFQLDRNSTKVYIPQDGKDYAVVYSEGIGEVPVNFKAEENGAYTLGFNAEEVEFNYLHLIDNMTGRDVDLLQTPGYSFEASVTDYESRFRLVFATGTADDNDSFAFYSNGSWIIGNEGEATLQVIDVTGRILSSETVNGSVSKAINAASGVYMLRLINGDNVKVQKIVVR